MTPAAQPATRSRSRAEKAARDLPRLKIPDNLSRCNTRRARRRTVFPQRVVYSKEEYKSHLPLDSPDLAL